MADCVFCQIIAGSVPAHVMADTDAGMVFLDTRPIFPGHALVVPRDHVPTLPDLPPDQVGDYFRLVRRVAAVLPGALGAAGTFVAVNNVVSQSVPHLHTHVVPRTKGDGLRGFFWPRRRYSSADEAAGYAARIRAALDGTG